MPQPYRNSKSAKWRANDDVFLVLAMVVMLGERRLVRSRMALEQSVAAQG